jgi:DNA-directed RNA polymerase specialized sigma24 family protein
MWYTILITLVVDFGGLLLVYMLLRDRVRRAASSESRIGEIRDEVSRLLVELNQATDRNIALMEDKISVLNEAISTADKKIGLLRRETEKHDVGSQIYSRLAEGRHRRTATSTPAAAANPPAGKPHAAVAVAESAEYRTAEANPPSTSAGGFGGAESAEYRTAEGGFGGADPTPSTPPLSVELSEQNTRSAAPPDPRQRVMMLYRAGFSPSLIASRVGAPLGEVELMIALEQRKGQA